MSEKPNIKEKNISFGKYFGSTFSEVAICDPDYFRILLKEKMFTLRKHTKNEILKAMKDAGHELN